MKLVIAAVVAAFAMPAIAQDMPAAPPPAPMPQTAPMPPAPPPVDPAAVAPPTDPVAPAPMPPAPMADAAPAPTTDGNYPMCTKTIVDHCTERSNARGERLHSTPRKPG